VFRLCRDCLHAFSADKRDTSERNIAGSRARITLDGDKIVTG
jgi:hypothetical protein